MEESPRAHNRAASKAAIGRSERREELKRLAELPKVALRVEQGLLRAREAPRRIPRRQPIGFRRI